MAGTTRPGAKMTGRGLLGRVFGSEASWQRPELSSSPVSPEFSSPAGCDVEGSTAFGLPLGLQSRPCSGLQRPCLSPLSLLPLGSMTFLQASPLCSRLGTSLHRSAPRSRPPALSLRLTVCVLPGVEVAA